MDQKPSPMFAVLWQVRSMVRMKETYGNGGICMAHPQLSWPFLDPHRGLLFEGTLQGIGPLCGSDRPFPPGSSVTKVNVDLGPEVPRREAEESGGEVGTVKLMLLAMAALVFVL